MVAGRHRPPIRYFAPNFFTGVSLLFALASILNTVDGNYSLAGWFILWCVLLDKLDGTVARLLKATSSFGVEFDSLADLLAFGVAPVVLLYKFLTSSAETGVIFADGLAHVTLICGLGFYMLAVAVRLARYNIKSMPFGDRFFYGLPTTLVGALLAAVLLTHLKYTLADWVLLLYPLFLFAGGIFMVSNLRIPKLVRRKNRTVNLLQWTNVLVVYTFGVFQLFPEYLLASGVFYAVVGVGYCLITSKQFRLNLSASSDSTTPSPHG
ncbi:MAG: CDP-alcohol phosphatidyltransferase family protein [Deltaproteobacteria bacterium]|nr:CDP-alcohol phosphatidyltransferase family protein [Deltaproteobacteria bacterium]